MNKGGSDELGVHGLVVRASRLHLAEQARGLHHNTHMPQAQNGARSGALAADVTAGGVRSEALPPL